MWLPTIFSELIGMAAQGKSAFGILDLVSHAGGKAILGAWRASGVCGSAMMVAPNVISRRVKPRELARNSEAVQSLSGEIPPFQALIEHNSDGTALLSLDGTVLYASPSTSRVIGNPEGSLIGRNIFDLLHPEDVRQALDSFEEVIESAGNSRTTEMRCQRPGGKWAWIESTTTNLIDNANVKAVVSIYRDIDARKRSEEKWRSLAVTDPLTGLKNYRGLAEAFEYELQRSSRTQRPFALLLMDMDGLKKVNDSLGHAVGNQAICRIAAAMQQNCRSLDTAARYGGDEFAMVLPESDTDSATITATRIEQCLGDESESLKLSVSIGISSYPADGDSSEILLRTADEKLYEVKSSRRLSFSMR
jgi:diguanylate cyclase (GGDEF)-like protein/PAS domain S-box-containing protein